MGRRSRSLSDRLWSKVRIGDPEECWPWQAGTDRQGYGRIRLDAHDDRRSAAHRVAFSLTYGDNPYQVIQVCGNKLCCNPAHLEAKHRRK